MELSQMYLNENPAAHEMFCPPLSGGYNLHVHQVDSQPYTSVHTPLPSGHPFSQQGVCLPPSLLPSPLFSPLRLYPPSPSLLLTSLSLSSHLCSRGAWLQAAHLSPYSPPIFPPSSLIQSSVAIGPLVIYITGFVTTLLLRLLNRVIGRYVSFYTPSNSTHIFSTLAGSIPEPVRHVSVWFPDLQYGPC